LGLCVGLPTTHSTWVTRIQLLVNPKSLWCKCFLQRRQRGAAHVCNVYDQISFIIFEDPFSVFNDLVWGKLLLNWSSKNKNYSFSSTQIALELHITYLLGFFRYIYWKTLTNFCMHYLNFWLFFSDHKFS